ncbi:MAG: cytochrome P450 [Longimicrobiaceae bacterium]
MTAPPLPPRLPGGLLLGSGPEAIRDPLAFYTRAQRELGDVVRFRGAPGLRWFLLSHPDHVEHVLRGNQRGYRKPGRFTGPVRAVVGRGLLANEGESWLHQRRLMQPAFHRGRLDAFARQMGAAAEAAAARLDEHARAGTPADLTAEMLRTTLQVVGTTLFSTDVAAGADRVRAAVERVLAHLNRRLNLPVTLPEWVPTPRNRRFRRALATLDDLVYGMIRERRERGGGGDDLLAMLLEARDADTGERMSERQVRDETITLILAGHETTAAALGWSWHLLMRHPEAMRRLHAEVDGVLGGRTPGMDDLPRLRWTRAVFEEALRLYPPAWALPREAVADDVVGGFRIPAGSLVVVCAWVTQRRGDLWAAPERFHPGRFLEEEGGGRVVPFSYYPFGAGARQCIGSHFALIEAQVVLATLAQRFRLAPLPGREVPPDATFTLRPGSPVLARVERR